MNTGQKILVTGGAGFIGANLIRKLAQQGHQNIHLLVEKNSNLWRLIDLLPLLTVHEIDLADFATVQTLIHHIKPSVIYHLASFGGMPNQLDSKIIYDVNFYGTMNLLEACKDVGFECFINTGSSSEYGIKSTAMREDMVLEPVSDYGVAKAAATQYCLKEALFNHLPVYTIRPFAVYGDYEMPTRLIPTICVNALAKQPIHLSSPHFVRDFIYIDDMVNLFIAVATQRPPNAYIFNGGTGTQSTIQNVVDAVQKITQKQLSVAWNSSTPRPWEPQHWQADTTQAHRILQWKAQYSLEQGITKSLAWFEKNMPFYQQGHYGSTPQNKNHAKVA
jgi:nucleoside-diphosphate-sugar epimerase